MLSWKQMKLRDEQRKARRRKKGHSSSHCHWLIPSKNKKLLKKKVKAKKERNKFLDKVRQTFRRKIFRRKI